MPEPTSTGAGEPEPLGGSRVWSGLLPALAFIAGAALSAVLFLVGDTGDDDDVPRADATPSAEPRATPTADELVVQVPSTCLEAAEQAEQVTRALADVADAAGSLDARALQESLDVVQRMRPEVEAAARACQESAASGRVVTPSPAPEPTPSPAPTPTASA